MKFRCRCEQGKSKTKGEDLTVDWCSSAQNNIILQAFNWIWGKIKGWMEKLVY